MSQATLRIPTTPFDGQRPGTSGVRKKTRVFMQPRYLENLVQSMLQVIQEDAPGGEVSRALVVGGDGRFYNRTAIQTVVRMAAANGFGHVLVGRGGLLSTPAMSAVIRRRGALGGLVLSASHNPGGIDADFGIKYNVANGGPAPEAVTERIYQHTERLTEYRTLEHPDLALDSEGSVKLGGCEVTIIDPLADYLATLESIFDFDALRALFGRGFRLAFDAMHGVTGPYAHELFERRLGAPPGSVLNGTPLEDFGGGHPDPNLVNAAGLVARMAEPDAPDLGAASDGDGDRNLILGRGVFAGPGDSLALIAEHARLIPGYRNGLLGVARSMPTSTAVDRVAEALGIALYETPTGWKFFGNLMDADKCTLCGEESFGTGSSHLREKDGVWAVVCWLSLLATTGKSVGQMLQDHWQRFGRSYYQRHDYEGLDTTSAEAMLEALRAKLPSLAGRQIAGSTVTAADDFSYLDPVDQSVSAHQGVRIRLADGSRIVARLSGTGTEGATLRLYVEAYRRDRGQSPIQTVLAPLSQAAAEILDLRKWCGRDTPTLVT
jgi:phosphoglucomutase